MNINNKAFKPLSIGSVRAKNRFIMPSMLTNYGNTDGTVSEQQIDYYKARALGGASIICTEAVTIDQDSLITKNMLRIDDDKYISGLTKLVDTIHEGGAAACLVLSHPGRQANPEISKVPLFAAYSSAYAKDAKRPHGMSTQEIKDMITKFACAAQRAVESGFDIIELDGAHGYLINGFVSPWSNKRTDEYGGSFENRIRFPLEIIDAIHERIGEDFPIIYRLNTDDFVDEGMTMEETVDFSKLLVLRGVNAISVSGGNYATGHMISGTEDDFCLYADNATIIKDSLDSIIPIIVANRIRTPNHIEDILDNNKADMVALGRPMIVEANYVNKLANNQEAEIRYCTSCQKCIDSVWDNKKMICQYNPTLGREGEFDPFKKTEEPKKLVVIGGGPAGMEAAYIAAKIGHEVVLFEKNDSLGGKLVLESKLPYKENEHVLNYLTYKTAKYNVDVRLGTEVTVEDVEEENPDMIFVATGSLFQRLKFTGARRKRVCYAEDILTGQVTPGKNIMILGGGTLGLEVGDFLVSEGCNVTVIEEKDEILRDIGKFEKDPKMARALDTMNIITNEKIREVNATKVFTDKNEYVDIDTVVIAVGYESLDKFSWKLNKAGLKFEVIGDAVEPRNLSNAISEGFEVAYNL